ncbi:antiviral reverse transcriptase Drt3a [Paraburkholderia sp. GAS82]|uniref:antiviral reverse transcriptase Drt3a n=1 Tax=Paraburkholderia sp. GAS82 TaxID=3035137 RepID=UPI003D226753
MKVLAPTPHFENALSKCRPTGDIVIELAYTEKRIAQCVQYRDLIKDKSLLDYKNRQKAAHNALAKINANTLFHQELTHITVRGKSAYKFKDIEQDLVSRLIAKNIHVNYRIRQQNRDSLIKNLVGTLKEGAPYNVFRFDIETFYEKIDREKLLVQLLNDGLCSRLTVSLIFEHFTQLKKQNIHGLPRGLGISATLSEFALHGFDRAIREESEIFFYGRFVDDIVLVTSPDFKKADAVALLDKNIFSGLQIHKKGKKISDLHAPKAVDSKNHVISKHHDFEYLGYQFRVFEKNRPRDSILGISKRHVEIDICSDKVEKISSRLISSFTSYLGGAGDARSFSLLENRVKALTGNFVIHDPVTSISIKTGIYYNYHEKNVRDNCSLIILDALLRGLLFSSTHKLSQRIQSKLDLSKRRKLVGYTFASGFYKRRLHRFTNEELKKLKEVWKK